MPPILLTPILITTDAVGGVWRYSLDLAQALRRRGTPVTLATLGPAPTPAQRAEAEGVTLVQTGLPLDWTTPDPATLAHTTSRLAALAALTGARSAHLHAPALVGAAPWPCPVVAVTHSCLATWWAALRQGPPPPDFAWQIEATRHGLHQAAAIVAPSHAHAAATRQAYGPLEITVIHNGCSPLPAAAGHTQPDPTQPRILTAARLYDEAKNLQAINQAAAHLPIHAAGPTTGPNGATIHLPHLHLLGPLTPEAMAQAYRTHEIYVSMSRYEPFGLSVLEAAAAGLRLVLSDIPTFRELWTGAATFTTPETLLPALRQALAQPGDGGAQSHAARYTIDNTAQATLEVHARCA